LALFLFGDFIFPCTHLPDESDKPALRRSAFRQEYDMQEIIHTRRGGEMGSQILVFLARRARATRQALTRESSNPFGCTEAELAVLEGQAREALESFKLAQALTSDGGKLNGKDWPQYLVEFPRFGILDVDLPEGFEDQSSFQNACPSFELRRPDAPAAEFPLMTIFVDFKDVAQREFKDEERFHVYVGERKNGPDFSSNDWNAVKAYVLALRSEPF
jgi:hypothetical protein